MSSRSPKSAAYLKTPLQDKASSFPGAASLSAMRSLRRGRDRFPPTHIRKALRMRRHVSGAHSKAAQGIFSSNIPTSTISAQLYIAHAYKHRAAGSSQDTGLKFRPHRAILVMRLNAATFSAAERRPAPRRNLLPAPPAFPIPHSLNRIARRQLRHANTCPRQFPSACGPAHCLQRFQLSAPSFRAQAAWRIACSDSCRSAPSFPGT